MARGLPQIVGFDKPTQPSIREDTSYALDLTARYRNMDPLAVPKISLRESLASLTTVSTSKSVFSARPSTSGSFATKRSSLTSFGSSNKYDHFEDVPKLIRTPWEANRSKRSHSTRTRPVTAKPFPARIFEELPQEIYECIVQQLQLSYFNDSAGTCTTCYMKDLYSLTLTSRSWERFTQRQLYVLINIRFEPCF
jgi:hypothetical protein